MSDTKLDITSLPARISRLEERQNIVSKYMVGLKRQFDGMTEALQQIAGLRQISSPNKAQTGFVSEEYVPIVVQPLYKTKRHRCPKRL